MPDRIYNIIEAPVCLGSPTRGTENAYSYLTQKGLAELFGKYAVFTPFTGERYIPEKEKRSNLIELETVMHIAKSVRKAFLSSFEKGYTPLCLGGDHSVVMGSLAASGEYYGSDNTALVYIDTHADINTEKTTLSGRIHGMPLAAALGLCTPLLDAGKNSVNIKGENIFIIGAHSIDDAEYGIMKENRVTFFTPEEVKKQGCDSIIEYVKKRTRNKNVHLSFDVDSIDRTDFTSTGYALSGGMSYREVFTLFDAFSRFDGLSGIDIVEYNPLLDKSGDDLKKLLGIFSLLID